MDKIQQALGTFDGIVINPAAYTHTSVAILDALKAVQIPAVEVHISDVSKREDFRQVSYARLACLKTYMGLGLDGIPQGILYLKEYLSSIGDGGDWAPCLGAAAAGTGAVLRFFLEGRPSPQKGVGDRALGPCPLTNRWGPAMLKIEHMFYF